MSLVPTIGSIGWATLNTGRAPPVVLEPVVPLAQPASAARPPTALADNTFLRSIICLLVGVDAAREAPCYIGTMISRSWFFAYFAFSHRSADGEAIA